MMLCLPHTLPHVQDDRSALLAEIRLGRALQHVNPPLPTPPLQVFVHDIAMAAIRSGVQLNVAPRPLERAEREEKVLDVSSELRKMQNKRRKQEVCVSIHLYCVLRGVCVGVCWYVHGLMFWCVCVLVGVLACVLVWA